MENNEHAFDVNAPGERPNPIFKNINLGNLQWHVHYSGLSLRAEGRRFSPAIMSISPGYFHSKIEPKELP